jgi:hypothetical protein
MSVVMEFTHPDDQTLVGPYSAEHSPQRKEYAARGTKRRTRGTVVLATFRYRTGHMTLYLPTQQQAATLADVFVSRLNEFNLVLKDGR